MLSIFGTLKSLIFGFLDDTITPPPYLIVSSTDTIYVCNEGILDNNIFVSNKPF